MGLAEIRGLGDKLRIDSKYFSKAAVAARHFIEAKPNERLEEITAVMRKGIFDIKADTYTEPGDGIPFIRIGDLKNGMIKDGTTAWISTEAHNAENKTALTRGDIAISKTAYPAVALITLDECNVSQDVIATKLSTAGLRSFTSEYVVSFLASSIGMALMEAEFQGNVQEHLGLTDARNLRIPRLEHHFQERIKDVFTRAHGKLVSSASTIKLAEDELARSLGLSPEPPEEPLAYVQSSRVVTSAARLDAQYFMPVKTRIIDALSALPGRALGDVFSSVREIVDPKKNDDLGPVRNFDVTHALEPVLDDENAPVEFSELGSAKKKMRKGDVAISRLRSYLKEIAIVNCSNDYTAVGSTEFIVLRPRAKGCAIAPETLMTFLRSQPVQTILKWCQDGSQHPRFSEKDLLSIPLPDAVASVSPRIEVLVKNALQERDQARKLTASAKRAVEIAVQSSEAAAERFLDEQGA